MNPTDPPGRNLSLFPEHPESASNSEMKHELIARRLSRAPFKCLCVILLAAGLVVAQESSSSVASSQASPESSASAHALLEGIVTRDPGSEPVKKALIELIAESQNDGANYTALTAADGSFRMENIKPGRYRLFVERTGYQEIDKHHRHTEGRVLTLTAGQEVKDVAIILQAAAVVEGRVTDEDGDPLAEAQVAVLRQTFVQGHSHWEQSGAERTNDLGEYRIAGLAPGKYFVAVTPPPDFRSLIETAGNAPGASSRAGAASEKPAPLVYQTTYLSRHPRSRPSYPHPVARWRRLSCKLLTHSQPQFDDSRFCRESAAGLERRDPAAIQRFQSRTEWRRNAQGRQLRDSRRFSRSLQHCGHGG